MRILIASHSYIVDLNCEKLRQLARLRPDIEVTVIVPQRWRPGGVQNRIIEAPPWQDHRFRRIPLPSLSENNQGLLTFGGSIIQLLRQFKPHIIHVEQGAKSLGYAQLILLNKLLGLRAKNCFFTWWNLPYHNKFPINLLEAFNLRNTQGLISGNQDGVDILREHGYRNAATVIPQLGVDEQLFKPEPQPKLRAELQIPADHCVIGFVGRFVPEKGMMTLLAALALLGDRPWTLLLLGRGELQGEIEAQAAAAGLRDRLRIVASVPHADVPRYINVMDVLVLPSETSGQFKTLTAVGWKEQFGHVLIEAMACGVPVVGSDSGEIPHVIGAAGLVFPEGDAAALRDRLATLIDSPAEREQWAELGYQRAMERYTNLALARQQLQFYESLLSP
ncbi:hormogonium polysaccharide biosynthesis glycosyltransferase HpsO [Spirulina major]|uniref:hormogonium polysaccharide biosynthesis glycosyltransferase HpsO n=1 Tax=Spirulina major TaxID=270636 RepID=UPI000933DC13|nr:hormogonium polysaccharide biosynthesis glycosyltransferase HpsO [Spirulina major]